MEGGVGWAEVMSGRRDAHTHFACPTCPPPHLPRLPAPHHATPCLLPTFYTHPHWLLPPPSSLAPTFPVTYTHIYTLFSQCLVPKLKETANGRGGRGGQLRRPTFTCHHHAVPAITCLPPPICATHAALRIPSASGGENCGARNWIFCADCALPLRLARAMPARRDICWHARMHAVRCMLQLWLPYLLLLISRRSFRSFI